MYTLDDGLVSFECFLLTVKSTVSSMSEAMTDMPRRVDKLPPQGFLLAGAPHGLTTFFPHVWLFPFKLRLGGDVKENGVGYIHGMIIIRFHGYKLIVFTLHLRDVVCLDGGQNTETSVTVQPDRQLWCAIFL